MQIRHNRQWIRCMVTWLLPSCPLSCPLPTQQSKPKRLTLGERSAPGWPWGTQWPAPARAPPCHTCRRPRATSRKCRGPASRPRRPSPCGQGGPRHRGVWSGGQPGLQAGFFFKDPEGLTRGVGGSSGGRGLMKRNAKNC